MLNENEIWRKIPEFEQNYEVSNLGRVRSIHGYGGVPSGHIKATNVCSKGYSIIKLYRDNKCFNDLIHRCVAKAFIPNPTSKETVNHIDGNKQNNCVENLEWVTYSENHLHAFATGLRKPSKNWLGKKFGGTSKYHNVTFDPTRNRWIASIKHNKKSYVKRFPVAKYAEQAEDMAALAVNAFIDLLGLTDRPKNFIF